MQGRIPDVVLQNTVRGTQGADVVLRLLAERERVDAELDALAVHPALAGRLWGDVLRDAWRRIQADPAQGAAELLRGVMAAKLLRHAAQLGPRP
jgi:hypothetical protein